MQAVILAGGKGMRLRPLTYGMPKPMIKIHGKPFLQHQLEFIKVFGINNILLLVSYLGDDIEKYFGDGVRLGCNIEYSYEETPLGTGGALRNAQDKIAEEFLLLNGDTFLPIDYMELANYLYTCRRMGVVTVYSNSDGVVQNNIAVGQSNLVIGYNKEDPFGMVYVDAGAMALKKEIVNLIPEGRVCSLEEEIFHKLIKRRELVAFITSQRFYDMGSFEGLGAIKRVLK